jgi:hypothetical protein
MTALKRFLFLVGGPVFLFLHYLFKRFPRVQSSNSLFLTPRKKIEYLIIYVELEEVCGTGFSQEDLAKFGYRSQRKDNRIYFYSTLFWQHAGTYCLNMLISVFFPL